MPLINVVRIILIILSICCLVSCSPVKLRPNCMYLIKRVPHCIPTKKKRAITLLVAPPETQPVYNTTRMTYSLYPYQIAYYLRSQWAETPAQMLQPLIVRTLDKTQHYHAIVTAPYVGRYDYILTTQIQELNQSYICCPPTLHLSVRAQITSVLKNEVVATKRFTVITRLPVYTPYGGVIAANRATAEWLTELAEFCLENTK